MIEQGYKESIGLMPNSVFTDIPLQWVEQFDPGVGVIIANIEKENAAYAEENKIQWMSDPSTQILYTGIYSELANLATKLTSYEADPTRGAALYDFINIAKTLFTMSSTHYLSLDPFEGISNPYKLCNLRDRYQHNTYLGYVKLKEFNDEFASLQEAETNTLLEYTRIVSVPVNTKLYEIEISDPDFRKKLSELGFLEKTIRKYPPGRTSIDISIDTLFGSFDQLVGDVQQKLLDERIKTDADIAEAKAAAQTQIDTANTRIDGVITNLDQYQVGVNSAITTLNNETDSLNSQVDTIISRVNSNEAAIYTEQTTRADAISAISTSLNAVISAVGTNTAAILNEQTTRATADTALSTQISQLTSRVSDTEAAIITEQIARATNDSAEATERNTLAVQLRGDYTGTDSAHLTTGLVYNERQARIDQGTVITNQINLVSAQLTATNAALISEQTARASADAAEATNRQALSVKLFGTADPAGVTTSSISSGFLFEQQQARVTAENAIVSTVNGQIAQLTSSVSDVQSMVLAETTTRVNADSAIASQVNTLATKVDNNTVAVSQLTSVVNGPSGVSAQWAVKTDINGQYMTGFGLSTTSPKDSNPYSQFYVLADSFALITPSVNGGAPTVPFYVGTENGMATLKSNLYSDWTKVSGSGKPQDNATYGATFDQNIFGKITSSNIATYIENLSVNTLQIAGNAVTIPVYSEYNGATLYYQPLADALNTPWADRQTVASINLSSFGNYPVMVTISLTLWPNPVTSVMTWKTNFNFDARLSVVPDLQIIYNNTSVVGTSDVTVTMMGYVPVGSWGPLIIKGSYSATGNLSTGNVPDSSWTYYVYKCQVVALGVKR